MGEYVFVVFKGPRCLRSKTRGYERGSAHIRSTLYSGRPCQMILPRRLSLALSGSTEADTGKGVADRPTQGALPC